MEQTTITVRVHEGMSMDAFDALVEEICARIPQGSSVEAHTGTDSRSDRRDRWNQLIAALGLVRLV